MVDETRSEGASWSAWAQRLSLPALAAVGAVSLAGVVGGGFYAYQTYDYVQHDNDFCMSCHLMEQPYEQFGRSAHRGLGCKACHQPTLLARSQMALTQIVENPEQISAHAEVPNELCAECHIEGDPEKWRLVANTAGHRVHLESDDPRLGELQCVECHSTSVHEFAPIDRTCGQASCHAENTIQLGAMSGLTIHCATCHAFVAPVSGEMAGAAEVEGAILPDEEECLSCHLMRARVHIPDTDPHGGRCAWCHNPHEQSEPRQAVNSCTDSGCHGAVDQLTGFHRGLRPGVVEDCLYCHKAHTFTIEGAACVSCHQAILQDSVGVTRPKHSEGVGPQDTVAFAPTHPVSALGIGTGMGGWLQEVQIQEGPRFLHSQHRTVECQNCHQSGEEHGDLAVRTLSDCRACHHAAPVSNSCDRCHDSADAPAEAFQQTVTMRLSVGEPERSRTVTFPHTRHADLACGTCHTRGLRLIAVNVDCGSCHEDHHQPENDCTQCHNAAPTSVHPPSEAHVTCSGSGCHSTFPFETVPRTRQVCLACHQDRQDHRPGQRCAECHTLPSPRGEETSS